MQTIDEQLDKARKTQSIICNYNQEKIDELEGARALLVADICTGSGCIACSIASEHPDTRHYELKLIIKIV